MDHHANRVSVEAIIPTRGLIGFETDLVNLTRGDGIMSHLFKEYGPSKAKSQAATTACSSPWKAGISTAYALNNIQERGRFFIGPQEEIYAGMIVGENAPPGRHAGQSVQGEKAHQHAQPGRRQGHLSSSRRSR